MPPTQDAWIEYQALFDEPGEELGRKGAEIRGATYEVKEIAGVRTYVVTPKKINKREQ